MVLPVTSGQIAEKIRQETGGRVDRDAVNYALRKVGVEPVGRAGIVRLFPQSAIAAVREFLAAKRNPHRRQPIMEGVSQLPAQEAIR
jgi:hypothetical protein